MAKKVFIDTNPLIYLVGGQEPYHSKVLNFLSDCIDEEAEFYTSTITDALQLASSIDCNCDVFLTNDKQLKQVLEAKVLYLGDL